MLLNDRLLELAPGTSIDLSSTIRCENYAKSLITIKTEVEKKLIDIIERRSSQKLDYQSVKSKLRSRTSQDGYVALARLNNDYEFTFNVLIKDQQTIPHKKVGKLCQKAPNTPDAFSFFFRQLQELDRISNNSLKQIFSILEEPQNSIKMQIGVSKAINAAVQYETTQSKFRSCENTEDTKYDRCQKRIGNVPFEFSFDSKVYQQKCGRWAPKSSISLLH